VYQSSFVRYERRGATVVPVRVTKQWIVSPVTGERAFRVVRLTEVGWPRRPDLFVSTAPGAVKIDTPTRAQVLASGNVKPAGLGACLQLDDAARMAA
jgi:hypothetical protein